MIPDTLPTEFCDRMLFAMNHAGEMVIQIEMKFQHRLHCDRLAHAVSLLLNAEPVLGCRFDRYSNFGTWQRLDLSKYDLLLETDQPQTYQEYKTRMIDSEIGPQLSAGILHGSNHDSLLLKVAHEVADAAAVKRIARTLSKLYMRLEYQPRYSPPPNIHGARNYEQMLQHVPFWARGRMFVNMLKETLPQMLGQPCLTLPLPERKSDRLNYAHLRLPRQELVRYGHQHGVTINDIFMTTFMRALAQVTGWRSKKPIRMNMTVDLRRYIPDGHTDGICNLSAVEPVSLGLRLEDRFEDTLARVSGIMKKRKRRWIGLNMYSVLVTCLSRTTLPRLIRFFEGNWDRLLQKQTIPPALTNMGQIPDLDFDGEPQEAFLLVPPIFPPMAGFGLSGYKDTLDVTSGVYPESRALIDAFLAAMASQLQSIIDLESTTEYLQDSHLSLDLPPQHPLPQPDFATFE